MSQPAFPAPLVEFVRLFNARRFWDSHEVLEVPWRIQRSGFYHGLILYASALVHAQRGNPHGVRAQFAKARRRLQPHGPSYLGVDVTALLSCAAAWTSAAGAGEEADYPLIRLDPALLAGTEPELRSAAT